MHHKTHSMATRYRDHDTEDVPAPQDSTPLDLVSPDHTMPRYESESSDKCNEEPDTHLHLAELQEQFQQLWDQLTHLESSTNPPAHILELTQLTDRLQHLSITLQPYTTPSLKRNPCTQLCKHTHTPCMPHREVNFTKSLLQDIPLFDGQDSLKLEDRLMDLETATDILTENHTCLA